MNRSLIHDKAEDKDGEHIGAEEEDDAALIRGPSFAPHRVFWNADEDNQLLKVYAACTREDGTDWATVARHLHKPLATCQRRLRVLMKYPQWRILARHVRIIRGNWFVSYA